MLGGFVLLLHVITHEVAQELRAGTIAGFRGCEKLLFQSFIDPEGKSCFAHGRILMCYAVSALLHKGQLLNSTSILGAPLSEHNFWQLT
jgi:hypothetical protein